MSRTALDLFRARYWYPTYDKVRVALDMLIDVVRGRIMGAMSNGLRPRMSALSEGAAAARHQPERSWSSFQGRQKGIQNGPSGQGHS